MKNDLFSELLLFTYLIVDVTSLSITYLLTYLLTYLRS
jgi:hypothetical protein